MKHLSQYINEAGLSSLKAYSDYEYYAIHPKTLNEWYKLFDTTDVVFDGFENNIITVNGRMIGEICLGTKYIVFNMNEDDKKHSKYSFDKNPYYKKK